MEIHQDYKAPMLVVADSWFGNDGLWRPTREKLGQDIDLLSRLRCNINIHELPQPSPQKKRGRPRKYGNFLGNTSELAAKYCNQAQAYAVNLYGRTREVMAYDRVVMLKNLRCRVRVVWIYRRTQWIALFSTDLSLTVPQIIEPESVKLLQC
ncbi:DDE superfamily endonuclease [Desulfonatronum zhilinae]|nr:DDE superfamily endonuclease [Desulfonatronum zhilinae]